MPSRRKAAILLSLFLVIPCLARQTSDRPRNQSKSDLSGTWTLDMIKSDFDGPKSNLAYDSLTLIISHRDPELRIVRQIAKKKKQWSQEVIYYTDGRGEKNSSSNKNETVQSKTYWDGNILVTKGAASMLTAGDEIISDTSDKWELSTDGRSLTQISSANSFRSKFGQTKFAFKERNVRRVFTKTP
jgi:hypothetical protein